MAQAAVAVLSTRSPGFDARVINVGFVVDKAWVGTGSLPSNSQFPCHQCCTLSEQHYVLNRAIKLDVEDDDDGRDDGDGHDDDLDDDDGDDVDDDDDGEGDDVDDDNDDGEGDDVKM